MGNQESREGVGGMAGEEGRYYVKGRKEQGSGGGNHGLISTSAPSVHGIFTDKPPPTKS